MPKVSSLESQASQIPLPDDNSGQYRLPPRPRLGSPRVIVCETSGRWAAALGRELGRELSPRGDFRIEQTRSVVECWERLHEAPSAFVVVELSRGNIDTWLTRMAELEWKFPLARVAVVLRRNPPDNECSSRYQSLAREAGAVFVATSLRGGGLTGGGLTGDGLTGDGLTGNGSGGTAELADVACRHLQRSPRPQKSVLEEIWDSLPWKV